MNFDLVYLVKCNEKYRSYLILQFKLAFLSDTCDIGVSKTLSLT